MSRVPAGVALRAAWWALRRTLTVPRPPDFQIGGPRSVYLARWYVVPNNRWLNVYLHHIRRDDDDRALHDHPWINVSVVLAGCYREIMPDGAAIRRRGSVTVRPARAFHRIEIVAGPVWTLFITGPKTREWGFLCPQGWRHWREFTAAAHGEAIGKGCE